MKLKFRKGNKILYGQDMQACRGIPSGVEFDVGKFADNKIILKARGYGDLEHGDYGNGAIYVFVNHLPPKYQILVKKFLRSQP